MSVAELEAEILDVATALGVVSDGELSSTFFGDPIGSLRTIISKPEQRAALLAALDGLMASEPPIQQGAESITRHPIVDNAIGSVAISIARSGSAGDPTVVVGLWASAATPDGFAVEVDIPLVQGDDSGVTLVAANAGHPVAVTAAVPVGWSRGDEHPIGLQSVALSALVIAPLDDSRIRLTLTGLDVGTGPADVALDPVDIEADLAHVLVSLLRAGLAQAGADPHVAALLENLPTLLGVDGELPTLPLAQLGSDAGAWRRWLGSLLSASVDARPALIHWLDALGQLLGAPALSATLTDIPGAADPLIIPIVTAGSAGFGIDLEVYVQTPAASTTPELHLTVRGSLAGDVAAVRGEAELLVVPLGGNTATRTLTMAQIVAESVDVLWPRGDASDPDFQVGVVRGGLRWDGTRIVPVLEIDGVHVSDPALVPQPITFDRLDLSNAQTIATEAKDAVNDVLTHAIGSDATAEAVLGLLGLGGAAGDLGQFVNDPLRAIGAFHRAQLAAGTYGAVAQQIAALFGVTDPITGSGSAQDPWFAPLVAAAPAGPPLTFGVAIWDMPSGADHDLHIGLRLTSPPPTRPGWSVALDADVVRFMLPASVAARPGLLGGLQLAFTVLPPQVAGGLVVADHLSLDATWAPGSPLDVAAVIAGVTITAGDAPVILGDISLPDGLTAQLIDASWDAVRALLDGVALSWGGSAGALVSALLGLGGSLGGLPASWPALTAPGGGIASLLGAPLELLRARLAGLVQAAVTDAGEIPLLHALDLLASLLGGRLPAFAHPSVPPLPQGPAITGDGTAERPFALALTDAGTPLVAEPIDLIAWFDPAPPAGWGRAAADVLAGDPALAVTALGDLGATLPAVGDAFAGLPDPLRRSWLAELAGAIDGTDGLVSADIGDAATALGATAADPVVAAHHLAPQNADAVVAAAAHLQANAAGAPVLLLAPTFAPSDVWAPLLVALGSPTTATVDLRVPGVAPDVVDLGNVPAAGAYLVDLADDGTATLADLATRLDRVVTRVKTLGGAPKVALVAHSISGLAAIAYAAGAGNAAHCAAMVTIATPLVALDPTVMLNGTMASGVRLARSLTPALTAAPALDAALGHLAGALDGCVAGAPSPYPIAAFTRALPAGTSVSSVPTLAVPAVLDSPVLDAVATTLSGALTTATAAATAPTHFCWGLRAGLDLGAAPAGGPQVAATVRLDLGRVALTKGAPDPPAPARRLVASATVTDPSGWLVGSGGTGAALDLRLRAAEVSLAWVPGSPPNFDVALYDAAVRGIGGARLSLADVGAGELLNGLATALAGAEAATQARVLLALLAQLGLVADTGAPATTAFYADAISAMVADPSGFLAGRVVPALEAIAPQLGLSADPPTAAGPRTWRTALGSLPLQLVLGAGPATVGIHTTAPLQAGRASLAGGVSFALDAGAPVQLDATLAIAGITLAWDGSAQTLTVAAPPVLPPLVVVPPPAGSALADALLAALARTGIAAAIAATAQDALGGAVRAGSVAGLFGDPAGWLTEAGRLGASGGGLDAGRIVGLMQALSRALDVSIAADGTVTVAPGMSLSVSPGTAPGDVTLGLGAQNFDLGGGFSLATLALQVAIAVTTASGGGAGGRAITPTGTVAVTVPLPGTWESVTVTVADTGTGLTLSVTPHGATAVRLLPTFDGLWGLVGGGVQALLPGVLDALVAKLGTVTTSPVYDDVLAVADALQLRSGAPPTFDSAKMAALVEGIAHGDLAADLSKLQSVVQALLPAGAPVSVQVASASGRNVLEVTINSLPAAVAVAVAGTATLTLGAPLAGSGPTIGIGFAGVGLGPVTLDLTLADTAGSLGAQATLAVALGDTVSDAIGFGFAPSLSVAAGGGGTLSIALAPLGAGNPPLITLAPAPGVDVAHLGELLESWAVPIIARVALDAAHDVIDDPLWTGGASAHELLRDAHVVSDSGVEIVLTRPLPSPPALLQGLIAALSALRIPVAPGLGVGVYAEGSRVGVGASGSVDIPVGDFLLTLVLGSVPISGWSDPAGVGVLLFDTSNDGFDAGVRLGGVGLQLARSGAALINTDLVTVGAVMALTQASIDFTPWSTAVHGAVDIKQLALPLGGSSNDSNPVAQSLLSPSTSPGDDKPANPPADLLVASSDAGLEVLINAQDPTQPLYVDVHRTFGPLHIDRLGLVHRVPSLGADLVGALVDGGVSVAGLSVDVQGLELDIPLKHPAEFNLWQVDLSGLAVSFAEGPVTIAGGLLKQTNGAVVEYDGELTVQVSSFGLTALGSYARSSGSDPFTSLFAFVVVNAPIGGPPFLFITGLAGGAGYNRQLVVPSDPAKVPTFPLIAVMDSSQPSGGNRGIGPLQDMSAAMPPRRGSYWVAAGIKFTTFELLKTRALAYVALDRGFQIGLVGLMNMALPTSDAAIVSVELALAASYSSADELLAIRAQLTNNSWLISQDCQLTGGFAFYSWFGDNAQVLLTIGGYGPHWFESPSDPHHGQYPVVPAVGFHWAVGGGIVVKGETYFALTPHQLAFGGRLEASYDVDPIRIWFTLWLDVDFQWDPLEYAFDAGVSIGAAFHFTIDLLFCSVTINVSISLSASIEVEGPPLHGKATVDLDIASVTVHFGTPPTVDSWLPWSAFASKYLAVAPDPPVPSGAGTSVATITYGQSANSNGQSAAGPPPNGSSTPTDPKNPYGSQSNPWPVLPEFGLAIASKAPLTGVTFQATAVASTAFTGAFDLAPMGPTGNGFNAALTVTVETVTGGGSSPADTGDAAATAQYGNFPMSVWSTTGAPDLTANQVTIQSSPAMTRAMSGVAVAFPVTIAPAAAPPNIPIATLVEEHRPERPLPFAIAAAPAPALHAAAQALTAAAVVDRVQPAHAAVDRSLTARPRLQAVLPFDRATAAAVRTRGHGTGHRDRLAKLDAAGNSRRRLANVHQEAHLWDLAGASTVRGGGEGMLRITALSPVGRVLADHLHTAEGLELELDPAAASVVISAAAERPSVAGWSNWSTVHQVRAGTALGVGCTLLLPCPVTRAGRPSARAIAAGRLTARLTGMRTVLEGEVATVIVVADAKDAAGPDDLVVSGERLVAQDDVRHGTRRLLVYGVTRRRRDSPPIAIDAHSEGTWRVAGVRGLSGSPREWATRLRRDPGRLPAPTAPARAEAGYRITTRSRRPNAT